MLVLVLVFSRCICIIIIIYLCGQIHSACGLGDVGDDTLHVHVAFIKH